MSENFEYNAAEVEINLQRAFCHVRSSDKTVACVYDKIF